MDMIRTVYKQMGNGVSVPVVKAVLKDFIEHNFISRIVLTPSETPAPMFSFNANYDHSLTSELVES